MLEAGNYADKISPYGGVISKRRLLSIEGAHPTVSKTLFEVLFQNGNVDKFPVSELDPEYENQESKDFGFYAQKGLFEEYATFGRGHGHDLAPYDRYH